MNNTTETIILSILSGSLSAMSSHIVLISVAKYIPNIKTLSSVMKKFLIIAFRYILPIATIIFLIIYFSFDKLFVLSIVFLSGILLFNILFDVIYKISKQQLLNSIEQANTVLDNTKVLKDLTGIVKHNTECIKCICENKKENDTICEKE